MLGKLFHSSAVRSVSDVVYGFESLIKELEEIVDHHSFRVADIEHDISELVSKKEEALKEKFRASEVAAKIRALID